MKLLEIKWPDAVGIRSKAFEYIIFRHSESLKFFVFENSRECEFVEVFWDHGTGRVTVSRCRARKPINEDDVYVEECFEDQEYDSNDPKARSIVKEFEEITEIILNNAERTNLEIESI